MAEERIQKIMAEQGLCSRRAAEQIIAEGRVKVNGHPVKVGDKMDPNRDVLHVDDERIYIQKNQQLYYLALYKPRGYVTTASDELGRKTLWSWSVISPPACTRWAAWTRTARACC